MKKLLLVFFLVGLCFIQDRNVLKAESIALSWPVLPQLRRVGQGYFYNSPEDFHLALDISTTAEEKPILAAEAGEVIKAGWMTGQYGCGETVSEEDWVSKGQPGRENCGGYQIRIRHGVPGDYYYTGYYHLQSNIQVAVGDLVAKAQRIGTMGDTGWAYGVHLHFVLNKNAGSLLTDTLNPATYLVEEPGEVDPPGVMSLVRSEFTVERTSPSLSEEVMFSTKLENNGEVPVYLRTVFLRLKKGEGNVEAFGLQSNQGTVVILPGESKLFDLRAPPITEPGLWRIDKVEAEDTSGHWFELGVIASHLMVGYQNLIKDHPAAASSERAGSGHGPQFANDGNMRTRWESEYYDPQWIEFDLDYEQVVNTIVVRSETAYPQWFNVKVRTNNSGWITVVSDVPGIQGNSTYISIAPQLARKIRFEFTQRGTVWGDSIWEIEVYNTSGNPIGGPMPTPTPIVCGPGLANSINTLDCETPTATFTPVPTVTTEVTTEPTNIPDTTPPEGHITSPVDGEYLGTGWFNATANATDSGSGIKKVEFHFWHDGAWFLAYEDWYESDGWSASIDSTGFTAQNDMKLLLHVEDNAGIRVQSNVVSGLSNVTPGCSLVWVPKPESINSGTVELTANYNGWWRATINGNPWTAFNVENGSASANVDLIIVSGESVTYIIAMWFPYEGGANYCATDVTVDNRPSPTSTATPMGGPVETPIATAVPTSTPIPTATQVPDTTRPEEVYVTSPLPNEYIGTGWFNATAHAVDYGSGVLNVEFHFLHDSTTDVVTDWNGEDGWSASFNATNLLPQSNMMLLVWAQDNAGNRVQSGAVTGLTNILPNCILSWNPFNQSNVGTIDITAFPNGWWNATIDGHSWTDVLVENGVSQKEVSFTFVPGEISHHTVQLWYPNVQGGTWCALDVVINDLRTPTPTATSAQASTPTPVPTSTATRTPPTVVPTATPTVVLTVAPSPTPTPIPMSGRIYGKISDENGLPVFGVDVQLWRDTQSSVYWVKWVEKGEYEFSGLPDSTWTVHVVSLADPEYWMEVEPKVVVISDAQRVHEIDFNLSRAHKTYQIFLPLVRRK